VAPDSLLEVEFSLLIRGIYYCLHLRSNSLFVLEVFTTIYWTFPLLSKNITTVYCTVHIGGQVISPLFITGIDISLAYRNIYISLLDVELSLLLRSIYQLTECSVVSLPVSSIYNILLQWRSVSCSQIYLQQFARGATLCLLFAEGGHSTS
jgi:hypothetical protein